MLRIEKDAWETILAHAARAYPEECCGALVGRRDSGVKSIRRAIELVNEFPGSRKTRYAIRPQDLLEADRSARRQGMDLIGIYHSHPDCDAYFSATDLKHSCPWYSFVVLSIRQGEFDHAGSWVLDPDRTKAEPEEFSYPGRSETDGKDSDPYAATAIRRQ